MGCCWGGGVFIAGRGLLTGEEWVGGGGLLPGVRRRGWVVCPLSCRRSPVFVCFSFSRGHPFSEVSFFFPDVELARHLDSSRAKPFL